MKRFLKGIAWAAMILVLVLTAAGFLYHPDTRIPEGAAGRTVLVDGLRLRVLQTGAGPNVLLIHGCPGSVEDWSSVIGDLSRRYRVTAYDRPGFGYSDWGNGPFTVEHSADVAASVIRTLGLEDIIVVGHSYGAATALALAERTQYSPRSIKACVLAGASPYGMSRIDPIYRLLAVPGLGTSITRLALPLLAPPMIRDGLKASFGPEAGIIPSGFVEERIRIWSQSKVAVSRAREVLNYDRNMAALADGYSSIHLPLFIVEGAAEQGAEGARRLASVVPGARITVLEGAGHYIPVLHARELGAAVDEAARGLRPRE